MDRFETLFKELNEAQQAAVEKIDGPLMVVAGPGTGKTQLLSMRVANILRTTDTLPSNILCLTFTESGAVAMRERLYSIIGSDAYKVAIQTFHGFGSDIINRYREYFYDGAEFQPADELTRYEIVQDILGTLDYSSPIASKMNGQFTYLHDILSTISDLKKSGLTSDELLQVLDADEMVYDGMERDLIGVFAARISKATVDKLAPLAEQVTNLPSSPLPPGITPLQQVLAESITQATAEAYKTGSTKPITAWKKRWLRKTSDGNFAFSSRKSIATLRAVSYVYYQYLVAMQERQLYDFDDMLLQSIHAIETHDDLRFDLQEQYLYILVDEFQDTNMAQARLLHNLSLRTDDDAPNIMVVGDDDQAIYRFQGADVSNIMQFSETYGATRITLRENYRSVAPVLSQSRQVITRADDRLETQYDDINKQLTAAHEHKDAALELHEYPRIIDERRDTAMRIQARIKNGVAPGDIAVLARRHHELVALLPYFSAAGIAVNYERQDNVLELEVIRQLVLLGSIIDAIQRGDARAVDAALPELLAHPAWNISPATLWKLSLTARNSRSAWFELLESHPELQPLHTWLLVQSKAAVHTPLEQQLDELIGSAEATEGFQSPLYAYFFSDDRRHNAPDEYIVYLEALRTIRGQLREYRNREQLYLKDFLAFVQLHEEQGIAITSRHARSQHADQAVVLLTAHGSKGLEFDHVFIVGALESAWGERVRGKSKLISYPENLEISIAGDHASDRLRLFYVAMTRARNTLSISYSLLNDTDKPTALAGFLADSEQTAIIHTSSDTTNDRLTDLQQSWHQPLVSLPRRTMQELLAPQLERYKLSATHLNAFLDITNGGPEGFLLNNLLHFPQAMSPSAAFGSAIHKALQRAHTHVATHGNHKPIEDVLHDFEQALRDQQLSETDFHHLLTRGTDALKAYLDANYAGFSAEQKAELSFANQESHVGAAHLTGILDLATIDRKAKTIVVTDYKTGKPSRSWRGASEFEKIKLHKYRQQLMFYQLLVEESRDYTTYTFGGGVLQFVEPEKDSGAILALEQQFSTDELSQFRLLIEAVWQRIITLDLPDVTGYEPTLRGIHAFEADLLDNNR